MGWVFDDDTALAPSGPGVWELEISDRWNVGPTPNGGFLMALLVRAAGQLSTQPHPLTVTAHFLSRTEPGPATVRARALKQGRTVSTLEMALIQGDRERVHALATFGDLDRQHGPTRIVATRPDVGPDDELVANDTDVAFVKIADRFDILLPPDQAAGPLTSFPWRCSPTPSRRRSSSSVTTRGSPRSN